jgi:hypothetical protein
VTHVLTDIIALDAFIGVTDIVVIHHTGTSPRILFPIAILNDRRQTVERRTSRMKVSDRSSRSVYPVGMTLRGCHLAL